MHIEGPEPGNHARVSLMQARCQSKGCCAGLRSPGPMVPAWTARQSASHQQCSTTATQPGWLRAMGSRGSSDSRGNSRGRIDGHSSARAGTRTEGSARGHPGNRHNCQPLVIGVPLRLIGVERTTLVLWVGPRSAGMAVPGARDLFPEAETLYALHRAVKCLVPGTFLYGVCHSNATRRK
jgi:hypothetical protein